MTENKREKYSRNNLQTCLFILFCEINIRKRIVILRIFLSSKTGDPDVQDNN
jgi:hypothetical protein